MKVLSLGAGVQSSTVLLMSCAGEFEHLDAAIFADTGFEPPDVYRWLETELVPRARDADTPLYVVRAYDDGRDVRSRPWEMPVHVLRPSGDGVMVRRQCTNRFKVAPIRRKLRELTRGPVEEWLGISADEIERMRDSDVRYITHRYPLVDADMTRADCAAWLQRRGLEAPKSACVCCPFNTDARWLRLKRQPEVWAAAIEVDESLRNGAIRQGAATSTIDGVGYLHRSHVPLRDVELGHEDQLELFGCDAGHCGV